MAVAIEAVGLTKYCDETPGIIDLDLEVMSGELGLGPKGLAAAYLGMFRGRDIAT